MHFIHRWCRVCWWQVGSSVVTNYNLSTGQCATSKSNSPRQRPPGGESSSRTQQSQQVDEPPPFEMRVETRGRTDRGNRRQGSTARLVTTTQVGDADELIEHKMKINNSAFRWDLQCYWWRNSTEHYMSPKFIWLTILWTVCSKKHACIY